MKHFMIKYQFANGITEDWHREIGRFIAALDNDAELKGKIIYRCLKNRDDSSYYHLAAAADEQAIKTLQARDFFQALYRKDPAGRRRRRRGHADGVDRRDRIVALARHHGANSLREIIEVERLGDHFHAGLQEAV
jgi:hypothetical protein